MSAAIWASVQVSGGSRRGTPLGSEIDEKQAADVAQRVEVVAEHRVVEPGATVQDEQRQRAVAALQHEQRGVAGLDQCTRHGGDPSSATVGRVP